MAAVAGIAIASVVALATPVSAVYGVLLGWDIAAVVYLVWVWKLSWGLDAESTAEAAVHEDPTRAISDVVLLGAAVASLVAVAFSIADASQASGAGKALRVALGVSCVVHHRHDVPGF